MKERKLLLEIYHGNTTQIEYSVTNIDKEAPQIIGCEDGGIYKAPLQFEYSDNEEIADFSVEKYEENLFLEAGGDREKSEISVRITGHPLNTKKYKYYINDELIATTSDTEYIFSGSDDKTQYTIMVQAIDTNGSILDTADVLISFEDPYLTTLPETDTTTEEENLKDGTYEILESGNYQIKVNDLAGNETIYNIKLQ